MMNTSTRLLLVAASCLSFGRGAAWAQCTPPPPASNVSTYCTAGTTVQGCSPSIDGVGSPSSMAASGFDIVVSNVPGQRSGTIFFGAYPAAVPWAQFSTSYRCVALPLQRTGEQSSGGVAGQCDGELRLDFNAWRAAHPNALGSPFFTGQVLNAQGWFRDPGAPKHTNLSNALRFMLDSSGPWPTPLGMVSIPAGTFLMGSNAASGAPYFGGPTEGPVHQVTLSYCFWMGETEVTQAQYSATMGSNPSVNPGASHPVEWVTWVDAQAYCAALTAQQMFLGAVPAGYQYRLPTEAEWEYACRAGTTTEFNVGAELFCTQARFWTSSHTNLACGSTSTLPVASYAPNAWGLYDMHGNVREWCLDAFASYSAGPVTDPFVTGASRIVRDGSWGGFSSTCRSAQRSWSDYPSETQSSGIGFRVVLAPILVP